MIAWFLEDSENGEDIGQAGEVEGLRNWAANLDDELPVFFSIVMWDDTIPYERLGDLLVELNVMLAKVETAPGRSAELLRAMRAVALRAQRAGIGVDAC